MAGLGAALYIGSCTGHGLGAGATHHPGIGGPTLKVCPHPPLTPEITPMPISVMNATVTWPPIAQLPGTGVTAVTNVVISGNAPILDGDILTPHPTPGVLTTCSALPTTPPCAFSTPTPAYWCVVGDTAGREAPVGHRRQLIATTKTVWVNGRRLGRMADPYGTGVMPLPCSSRVSGASPNVFVGI